MFVACPLRPLSTVGWGGQQGLLPEATVEIHAPPRFSLCPSHRAASCPGHPATVSTCLHPPQSKSPLAKARRVLGAHSIRRNTKQRVRAGVWASTRVLTFPAASQSPPLQSPKSFLARPGHADLLFPPLPQHLQSGPHTGISPRPAWCPGVEGSFFCLMSAPQCDSSRLSLGLPSIPE